MRRACRTSPWTKMRVRVTMQTSGIGAQILQLQRPPRAPPCHGHEWEYFIPRVLALHAASRGTVNKNRELYRSITSESR